MSETILASILVGHSNTADDIAEVTPSDLYWFVCGAFKEGASKSIKPSEATAFDTDPLGPIITSTDFVNAVIEPLRNNSLPIWARPYRPNEDVTSILQQIATTFGLNTQASASLDAASLQITHLLLLADFLRRLASTNSVVVTDPEVMSPLEVATAIYLELSSLGVEFSLLGATKMVAANAAKTPAQAVLRLTKAQDENVRASRIREVQLAYRLLLDRNELSADVLAQRASLDDSWTIADLTQSDEFRLAFLNPACARTLPPQLWLAAVSDDVWTWAQAIAGTPTYCDAPNRLDAIIYLLDASPLIEAFKLRRKDLLREEMVSTLKDLSTSISARDIPELKLTPSIENGLLQAGLLPSLSVAQEMAALVDLSFYRQAADIMFGDLSAAQHHYLVNGIAKDIAPNPLFDPDWIRQRFDGGLAARSAMQIWSRQTGNPNATPSPFFDPVFYTQMWKDVPKCGNAAYAHFIQIGQKQGRACGLAVEPRILESSGEKSSTFETLTIGLLKGDFLSRLDMMLWRPRAFSHDDEFSRTRRMAIATLALSLKLGARAAELAVCTFCAETTINSLNLGINTDPLEVFEHFCREIESPSLTAGPLFDEAVYMRNGAELGLMISADRSPYHHWLCTAHERTIATTTWFDSLFYSQQYVRPGAQGPEAFLHFVLVGQFDGRALSDAPALDIHIPARSGLKSQPPAWAVFWGARGFGPLKRFLCGAAEQQEQIADLVKSPFIASLLQRASSHDPAIGSLHEIGRYRASPYWDSREFVRLSAIDAIPAQNYDTLVCIPWLRTGGADWIAMQICRALSAVQNSDGTPHRVLLAVCDQSIIDRTDWIPQGVDFVDLSEAFQAAHRQDMQLLLYGLTQQLGINTIINVNSRLCFEMFARFGSRLSGQVTMCAYYFCWDQNVAGDLVGYPGEYFGPLFGVIDFSFLDSQALHDQLHAIYRWPSMMKSRVQTLLTPYDGPQNLASRAPRTHTSPENREGRPRILWAGRLDRQKRFDLVIAIASKLPGYDFLCWGEAALDQIDYAPLPANLILSPSYKSFDELPLDDFNLWLFTSSWEGTPTILIELGGRGVPIVASIVGGVGALIDEETGWPVYDIDDPSAYCAVIDAALENPEVCIQRASALQERVLSRHGLPQFQKQLQEALGL